MRTFFQFESLESRRLLSAVRLAVVGDFSVDTQAKPTQDVSNLIKSWAPSDVITVGDNNYPDGAASTIDANVGQWYHQYMSPYSGAYGAGTADGVNHFFPALGNHDWNSSSGATPFTNYFNLPNNERYYATQIGNVGIFVVDSESQEPDGTSSTSAQANWIRNAMLNSTAQWKLVFFHHPAYSSGGMGSNSYMQWPFATWGASAIFAGHDHDYERMSENGIPYFIDGLGGESIVGFGSTVSGSQVRYAGDYGAMRIDASDTSMTFQFITRTGALIDSYTLGIVSAPAAPTNLVASATSAAVNLTWQDNSTNETGFKIERSTDNMTFSPLATVASGASTYSDTSVVQGSTYFYRVRATNSGGDSTISNVASATVPTSTTVNLIPPGSTWKYLDNGINQATLWRANSFDDSAWKSGKAELGYGDGDEATVVGYGFNANNKYITTYFRSSFSLADPSSVSALSMQIVQDDGAIVYLNGTEVYRWNMSTGAVSYTTLAVNALGGADESMWRPATINPSLLLAGTNVMAVEIHQADVTSSDISFNFQLAATMTQTATLPAAPINLLAAPFSATQIMLTWQDNSTNESGFKIERSTDGVNFTQIAAVSPNVITYTDGGLSSSVTYSYRVRATNSSGDSGYSNISASSPYTIPAAPTNLIATASGSQINLTWADNSNNESGFKIERSLDGVTFNLIYGADEGATSYGDVNVSVGTNYYYRVRATNPAGDSSNTNIASGSVAAAGGTVYLSDIPWSSATNGYGPVELNMSNGSINAGDGHTITLNGVAYAKGFGVHADSQIVYNLGGAYSTFIADVGIDDEVSDTGTVIFQVLLDGVKVFDSGIMRATSVTQSVNLNVTGAQQLTLLCVDDGDGYVNDHGDWAGARLTALTAGPAAPAAPTNLAASGASTTSIALSWLDNSTNESGFDIERSLDGISFSPLFTTAANTTTFTDGGLSSGLTYWYRVAATNNVGNSVYSNIASTTTSTIPAAPTNLLASAASSTQINLTWADNSTNETGFKIERSTDGVNFSPLTTTLSNVMSYSDSGLVSGAKYFYRVRATAGGGDSANTNIVSATTTLPSPSVQGDVGSVGKTGSATYNDGLWTVQGAGADIAGKSDSFHFVYQALTRDGTIIARVTGMQNTNSSAKAGVMIRESLSSDARQATVDVKPGGGYEFIRRTSTGGQTSSNTAGGSALPEWVKLVRAGSTFTAYKSTDGANWTKIASASIGMASQVYIGLVVCSRSNSVLNTSTLDHVQLSGGVAAQSTSSAQLFSTNQITSNNLQVIP